MLEAFHSWASRIPRSLPRPFFSPRHVSPRSNEPTSPLRYASTPPLPLFHAIFTINAAIRIDIAMKDILLKSTIYCFSPFIFIYFDDTYLLHIFDYYFLDYWNTYADILHILILKIEKWFITNSLILPLLLLIFDTPQKARNDVCIYLHTSVRKQSLSAYYLHI